jgi:hypothetical protein
MNSLAAFRGAGQGLRRVVSSSGPRDSMERIGPPVVYSCQYDIKGEPQMTQILIHFDPS